MQFASRLDRCCCCCCCCCWLLLLLIASALLPGGQCAVNNTGKIDCYECNVFIVESGRQVQCQEYIEDPDRSTKDWIVVPISTGKIPRTGRRCIACGTFVAWSRSFFRKPRGEDESQVTLAVSRFCVKDQLDSRFSGGRTGCIDNLGSHSYLQRCYCFEDGCNNYDQWDMKQFGP